MWQVGKCSVSQLATDQWEWMPEESELMRWQEKENILSDNKEFN